MGQGQSTDAKLPAIPVRDVFDFDFSTLKFGMPRGLKAPRLGDIAESSSGSRIAIAERQMTTEIVMRPAPETATGARRRKRDEDEAETAKNAKKRRDEIEVLDRKANELIQKVREAEAAFAAAAENLAKANEENAAKANEEKAAKAKEEEETASRGQTHSMAGSSSTEPVTRTVTQPTKDQIKAKTAAKTTCRLEANQRQINEALVHDKMMSAATLQNVGKETVSPVNAAMELIGAPGDAKTRPGTQPKQGQTEQKSWNPSILGVGPWHMMCVVLFGFIATHIIETPRVASYLSDAKDAYSIQVAAGTTIGFLVGDLTSSKVATIRKIGNKLGCYAFRLVLVIVCMILAYTMSCVFFETTDRLSEATGCISDRLSGAAGAISSRFRNPPYTVPPSGTGKAPVFSVNVDPVDSTSTPPEHGTGESDQCRAYKGVLDRIGEVGEMFARVDEKLGGKFRYAGFVAICAIKDNEEAINSVLRCVCTLLTKESGSASGFESAVRKLPPQLSISSIIDAFGWANIATAVSKHEPAIEMTVLLNAHKFKFTAPRDLRFLRLVELLQNPKLLVKVCGNSANESEVKAIGAAVQRFPSYVSELGGLGSVAVARELIGWLLVNDFFPIFGYDTALQDGNIERMFKGSFTASFPEGRDASVAAVKAINKYFQSVLLHQAPRAQNPTEMDTKEIRLQLTDELEKMNISNFGKTHKKHRTDDEKKEHERKKEHQKKKEEREQRSRSRTGKDE